MNESFELAYDVSPFAWRQTVFTRDGQPRYILDVANEDTIQACRNVYRTVIPMLGQWCVVRVNADVVSMKWMSSQELAALIESEGWACRPPPEGETHIGMWDGRGEWMSSDPEEVLPPDDVMGFAQDFLRKVQVLPEGGKTRSRGVLMFQMIYDVLLDSEDSDSETWQDHEMGADLGDLRRCPHHPNQVTSNPDGMFDAPCGMCEHEIDIDYPSDAELRSLGWEMVEGKWVQVDHRGCEEHDEYNPAEVADWDPVSTRMLWARRFDDIPFQFFLNLLQDPMRRGTNTSSSDNFLRCKESS